MTSPRSTREATRREAGSARKGESGISAINCQDHPMTNNPTDDELRALLAKLATARANGDPADYFFSMSVAEARQAANAITTLIEYRQQVQDLKDTLYNYLHAFHPASQRVCAEEARRVLATLTKESRV